MRPFIVRYKNQPPGENPIFGSVIVDADDLVGAARAFADLRDSDDKATSIEEARWMYEDSPMDEAFARWADKRWPTLRNAYSSAGVYDYDMPYSQVNELYEVFKAGWESNPDDESIERSEDLSERKKSEEEKTEIRSKLMEIQTRLGEADYLSTLLDYTVSDDEVALRHKLFRELISSFDIQIENT